MNDGTTEASGRPVAEPTDGCRDDDRLDGGQVASSVVGDSAKLSGQGRQDVQNPRPGPSDGGRDTVDHLDGGQVAPPTAVAQDSAEFSGQGLQNPPPEPTDGRQDDDDHPDSDQVAPPISPARDPADLSGQGQQDVHNPPPEPPGRHQIQPNRRPSRLLQDYGVYAALLLLVLYNLVFTGNFASVTNLNTQLVQVTPTLIAALGMALVIGTEGVDLSVGSVMALAAALLPLYLGYGLVPALLIALLGGALCGLFSGTLVAVAGIQPIVATLALLVGGRGLALVFADGQLKDIRNQTLLQIGSDKIAGIPIVVVIAAVLTLVVGFLVRYTTFGRQLVAIGGNRSASALAGLPVKRVLMTTYVISGVLAAIAGTVATARLTASDPSAIGQLAELAAITAVVVGGTPLSGGRVRVLGTVAGALLMQLISATLIKNNLPTSASLLAQAAIIVVAVFLQRSRQGGTA